MTAPFQTISWREPLGLRGEEMSKDQLRDKVRELIDGDTGDLSVSDGTDVNGKIPSYNFQVKTGNGAYSVDLAKREEHWSVC